MLSSFYESHLILETVSIFIKKKKSRFTSWYTKVGPCAAIAISDRQQQYHVPWSCLHVPLSRSSSPPCLLPPWFKLLSHSFLISGLTPSPSSIHPLTVSCSEQIFSACAVLQASTADKSALAFDVKYSSQMMTMFFEAACNILIGCDYKPAPKD